MLATETPVLPVMPSGGTVLMDLQMPWVSAWCDYKTNRPTVNMNVFLNYSLRIHVFLLP